MSSARPNPRVVIVGGGIIGLACAEALSRDGTEVCVLDQGEPGRAASWAGGGMLTPLPPDHIPDWLREPLAESLALYPEWCERLHAESGIDPEYWVCGATYIRANGERLEYPQMAQVRNPRLIRALLEVLRRRGVSVQPRTRVLDWLRDGDAVRGVHSEEGVIPCEAAILAAGAWSAVLGADGVRPVKGQMLLCRTTPGTLERMLIGEDVYLIPRRDGCILVGSSLEEVGFDVTPTSEARARLLEKGARLWPALAGLRVEAHWAGLRPCPAADAPLLGRHPSRRRLWLATGHHRLGITLAPGAAAFIEREIRGAVLEGNL